VIARAAIIAIIQLAWLIRLIARHPVAATVAAVLILAWLNIGWLGLVLLVVWTVVVLTAWRFFWPSSFTRWIAGPARGRWRGWWCYRRRWAGVMAISEVAPWHQGRIVLPVLGEVASTRYIDRVPVRLGLASPRLIWPSARRTWRTGSVPCCAVSAPPGPGGWCWSSSAATPWPRSSPPCPSPPTRI
jgi:hypothetical protein